MDENTSLFHDTGRVKSGQSPDYLGRLNIVPMMSESSSTRRVRHREASVTAGTTYFLGNFQSQMRGWIESLLRLEAVVFKQCLQACPGLTAWALALASPNPSEPQRGAGVMPWKRDTRE